MLANIVQENHYYPYGLNSIGLEYTDAGPDTNHYALMTGKELVMRNHLEYYDFGARMYDPRIGRWISPDPLSEKFKSYTSFKFNKLNPLNHIDPNGLAEYHFSENENDLKFKEFMAEAERERIRDTYRNTGFMDYSTLFTSGNFEELEVFEPSNSKDPILVNPSGGRLRGLDNHGSGHYLASRDNGKRLHFGIDITTKVGQKLVSPISGIALSRIGNTKGIPMIDIYPIDKSLGIDYIRILYVNFDKENLNKNIPVVAGQSIIGQAADLSKLGYPKDIVQHIHIQIRSGEQWIDPTPFFFSK